MIVTFIMYLSCFVTCVTITYNVTLYPLFKSKIRNSKNKNQNKIRRKIANKNKGERK